MHSTLPLHLTLPPAQGEISGGHIYNARLAEGLTACSAFSTLPIDDLSAHLAGGTTGFFLIDSLDLERVEALPPLGAQQRLGLIAHHLPSLDCFGAEAAERRVLAQARERKLLARFDLVVATGTFGLNYIRALGVAASRVVLIPPAPPRPAATVHSATAPPSRALLVANLIPRKGVFELLEALAPALSDDHAFELSIVGRFDLDPAYAARCVAFIASTPLSRVLRLLGPVPPQEMGAHYQKAHVFVSASRMETFGMALQEARSFGLPILALAGGNAAEHVSSDAGRLFTSAADLARGLLEIMAAPDELSRLQKRAQQVRVNTAYDWTSVAKALLDACSCAARVQR